MTSYPYRPFVVLSVALCIIAFLVLSAKPARASGVVTECTDAGLTQALVGGGTVIFDCPGPGPHTIPITAVKTITESTQIDGDGEIILDGQNRSRIFMVEQGASLNLDSLTITRGFADYGGAIQNHGMLTISNSVLRQNSTFYGEYIHGGGVANYNFLIIHRSLVEGNSAPHGGGGVYNSLSGDVYIEYSTFIDNQSKASGYINGNGGGLYNVGIAFITNTTFISNSSASDGGGLINTSLGHITIANSTFSGNSPTNIYQVNIAAITNTIIANGITSDCSGFNGFTGSNNLSSDASCTFDGSDNQINTDPQLGPLVYFGVGVPTYSLLPGSPAIDAGTNAGCPASDQRGFARPFDARCDIGAFEWYALFPSTWYVPIMRR